MEQTKYDVFISYSRKDTDTANRICAALEHQGISYFIDRQGIGGGQEFPEVLADAIVGCRIMLYIASSNSYRSKFTNNEIAFAFNEKSKGSILPYIIDGSRLPTSQRFIFASVNIRTLKEHPIDTILMQDLCQLLGRKYKEITKDTEQNTVKKNSEQNHEKNINSTKSTFSNNVGQFIGKIIDFIGTHWYIILGFGITAIILAYLTNNYYCLLIISFCGIMLSIISIISIYHSNSINDKGLKYYNQGDYRSALRFFFNAAEMCNPSAQYNLGRCYYNGHGVPQDYKEAVKWYKKAAEQGYGLAQYHLGVCYENGKGVPQDYMEALKWYRKAEEQGYVDAKNRVKTLETGNT